MDLEDSGDYLCTASDGYTTVSADNATVVTVLPNEGWKTLAIKYVRSMTVL